MLAHNSIERVPDTLARLGRLQRLELSYNLLPRVPLCRGLTSLEVLLLDHNRIGHAFFHGFPDTVSQEEQEEEEQVVEEEEVEEEEGDAGVRHLMAAINLRTLHLQHNLLVHLGGVTNCGVANLSRLTRLSVLR